MIRTRNEEPSLWEISASTSMAGEEAVTALFEAAFQHPPSVYLDADTRAVKVSIYRESSRRQLFRLRTLLRAGLIGLRACGLDSGRARIQVRRIRREEWAESWKRHFKPLEIGRALLIKPSWSRRKPGRYQAVVTLDPGLSFGTGRHPTTLFCLQQIVKHHRKRRSQSLLDIGTGSGILAIAAAAVGYRPVKAFDFDPAAVRISSENAAANGLGSTMQISRKDLNRLPAQSREKFDVICANLTGDLLLGQRHRILNRLATGGVLVVAGTLHEQFKQVQIAYETEGMRMISSRRGGEWQSGAFRWHSANPGRRKTGT